MIQILPNYRYFFNKKNLLPLICIGNCLEFYCFSLFAYNFKQFGEAFFSTESEQKALFYVMIIFSAGYYLRPLGSFLFGRISDIYSRRLSIILSSSTMALATLGIGLLPSYASLSILSPIFFIFFRLIQGLSVGGEFSCASVYLIENTAIHNRSFISGCITNSGVIGFTLANWSTVFIQNYFSTSYAWRYTYIIGSFLLVFIYTLRLNVSNILSQKINFLKPKEKRVFLLKYFDSSFMGALVVSFFGIFSTYTVVAALPLYLKRTFSFHLTTYEVVFFYALISIFLSLLVRKVCFRKTMRIYLLLAATLCIIALVVKVTSPFFIKVIFTFLFVIGAGYSGLIQLMLFSKFSPKNRYTLSGLSFSISTLLLGGTAPLILHTISEMQYPLESLFFFILLLACFSFIGTFQSYKQQKA